MWCRYVRKYDDWRSTKKASTIELLPILLGGSWFEMRKPEPDTSVSHRSLMSPEMCLPSLLSVPLQWLFSSPTALTLCTNRWCTIVRCKHVLPQPSSSYPDKVHGIYAFLKSVRMIWYYLWTAGICVFSCQLFTNLGTVKNKRAKAGDTTGWGQMSDSVMKCWNWQN
jgi:hypothetical protein